MHGTVALDAPVYVLRRRGCFDLSQVVGLEIQQILPVVVAILATGRIPFDKEKLTCLWDVAGSFVDLKRQHLGLLHCRIWTNDVEESPIVSYEA